MALLYCGSFQMFKTKWRVVIDEYNGYEVQFRYWWMPFYMQYGINTHQSVEMAIATIARYKEEIARHKQKVVYQE